MSFVFETNVERALDNVEFHGMVLTLRNFIRNYKKIGKNLINSFLDVLCNILTQQEEDIDIFLENMRDDLKEFEYSIIYDDDIDDYTYIKDQVIFYEKKMLLVDNLRKTNIKNNYEDFELVISYLVILKIATFVPKCPELDDEY